MSPFRPTHTTREDPAPGPGTKDGFTKDDCGQPAAIQQQQQQPVPQPQPQAQPEPAAAPEQPAGGVLGALGSVGAAELPFTGLPLWIAALAGIALVSAGLGARRAIR